jgi:hypothetical protein
MICVYMSVCWGGRVLCKPRVLLMPVKCSSSPVLMIFKYNFLIMSIVVSLFTTHPIPRFSISLGGNVAENLKDSCVFV